MDSSKFSLQVAQVYVRPIIDHLSFRPLEACLKEKRKFGRSRCTLNIFDEIVVAPLSITLKSLVWPVTHVRYNFFSSTPFGQTSGFTDRVILAFKDSGDLRWLLMESEYENIGSLMFLSKKTVIGLIKDNDIESFRNVVETLPEDLLGGITRWVAESIERREKNLTLLQDELILLKKLRKNF